MSRPLRVQFEGATYHVVTRGVRKLPLFTDDRDRTFFLELLDETVTRYGWELHAYCLMTNHFHLLVSTPGANISAGMQYLNGRFAQWFNWRHDYEGHLVERRFWSKLIDSDEQLFETARYIVLNPVRAGICPTAGGWLWSSYRAMVSSIRRGPRLALRLLRIFAPNLEEARAAMARYVRQGDSAAVG